jgi:hypothetical protein
MAAGVVLAGVAGEPAVLLTLLDCVGASSELEQPSTHNPPNTKYFAYSFISSWSPVAAAHRLHH